MKNILCFGDSNTWGYSPTSTERYGVDKRWGNILGQALGNNVHIIEEGLAGRTIASHIPDREHRSGKDSITMLLESHHPIDLVIVMLGTNDLQHQLGLSPAKIAKHMKLLAQLILQSEFSNLQNVITELLIVAPAHLADLPAADQLIFKGGQEKSQQLAKHYQQVAEDLNVGFFDAQSVVNITDLDGIHWTQQQHQCFAQAITSTVKTLLTPNKQCES